MLLVQIRPPTSCTAVQLSKTFRLLVLSSFRLLLLFNISVLPLLIVTMSKIFNSVPIPDLPQDPLYSESSPFQEKGDFDDVQLVSNCIHFE